jgi:HAD superfamily hydrolase (TIGR01458 family)
VAAVLLDIDGVLHVSGIAIPGAADGLRRLREAGHRLRFVTNNTIRSRARLAGELRAIGFGIEATEIETTPLAAGRLLAGRRVLPVTAEAIHADLANFVTLVERDADVVLVGGAEETSETARIYSYESLNRAFAELQAGARLVALHKNRWWQTAEGPKLDGGAFVAGLEYAAGVEAEVVGKPSRPYFESALAALGVPAGEATMVGDDVETDVSAAIELGMRGVLVRTGKFRAETLAAADPKPDGVIDSVADLAEWLAGRAESGTR